MTPDLPATPRGIAFPLSQFSYKLHLPRPLVCALLRVSSLLSGCPLLPLRLFKIVRDFPVLSLKVSSAPSSAVSSIGPGRDHCGAFWLPLSCAGSPASPHAPLRPPCVGGQACSATFSLLHHRHSLVGDARVFCVLLVSPRLRFAAHLCCVPQESRLCAAPRIPPGAWEPSPPPACFRLDLGSSPGQSSTTGF